MTDKKMERWFLGMILLQMLLLSALCGLVFLIGAAGGGTPFLWGAVLVAAACGGATLIICFELDLPAPRTPSSESKKPADPSDSLLRDRQAA
ncbi:MAG: hypothetical protein Q4C22_02210 [Bacillota bacterium]|nr:hypothetical protein [Bacillota bacterium]